QGATKRLSREMNNAHTYFNDVKFNSIRLCQCPNINDTCSEFIDSIDTRVAELELACSYASEWISQIRYIVDSHINKALCMMKEMNHLLNALKSTDVELCDQVSKILKQLQSM